MRRRFELIAELLPRAPVPRLLEIGFGSGVFMPYLRTKCDELYGIDVHSHVRDVQSTLEAQHIGASLSRQDAADTHFPDGFFDVVVSVSALEFIERIDAAACEISRILTPQGLLITVMPAQSRLLDFMLFVLTGANARADYGDRRERVLPALLRHFRIVNKRRFIPVYNAYALQRGVSSALGL